jgi:hypothetical protein
MYVASGPWGLRADKSECPPWLSAIPLVIAPPRQLLPSAVIQAAPDPAPGNTDRGYFVDT